MLSAHHAYLLGFIPQALGIFFNGLLVLERVSRLAEGELVERVQAELRDWIPSRSGDVVHNVHLVEAMLATAGKEAGEPPQTIEEFHTWAERVNRATYQAAKETFEGEIDDAKKSQQFRVRLAQDLGQQIGEIVQLTGLGSLVQTLLATSPDNPLLRTQATRLGEAQTGIRDQLDNMLNYTAGHADIQAEVRRVLALLTTAPNAGSSSDHATTAARLGDLAGQLDLPALEQLFAGPGPASMPS